MGNNRRTEQLLLGILHELCDIKRLLFRIKKKLCPADKLHDIYDIEEPEY